MAGEDEQYDVYRQVVERMAPRPVTIRTFDIDERQLARPLVDAALDARWFPEPERVGQLRAGEFALRWLPALLDGGPTSGPNGNDPLGRTRSPSGAAYWPAASH